MADGKHLTVRQFLQLRPERLTPFDVTGCVNFLSEKDARIEQCTLIADHHNGGTVFASMYIACHAYIRNALKIGWSDELHAMEASKVKALIAEHGLGSDFEAAFLKLRKLDKVVSANDAVRRADIEKQNERNYTLLDKPIPW